MGYVVGLGSAESRDEMSYGSDTWYMGRIYEELKKYACVWLISICIIN